MKVPKWVQGALWFVLIMVFAISAVLALLWLAKLVTIQDGYGKVLVGCLILELLVIGVGIIRSMAKSNREETQHSNQASIQKQMAECIQSANSRVDIFSNSFGWIDPQIRDLLHEKSNNGIDVCLYVPEADDHLKKIVSGSKITLKEYPSLGIRPPLRFTLLDKDMAGARRLAVGQGNPPTDFRITLFEESLDPQILALADLLAHVVDAHIRLNEGNNQM